MSSKGTPQIKFYKDAVPDIVSGQKTLEPRPRSDRWIKKVSEAKEAYFTYGPRIGTPKIFAKAEIVKVEIRPFETATQEDLKKIALGWQDKTPQAFIREYTKWFAKELAKDYQVAWIYFKLIEVYE